MSSNIERLPVVNSDKLTWGELLRKAKEAGIKEEDEIDNISISWGSPDKMEIKKDDDFGWQITLGINL